MLSALIVGLIVLCIPFAFFYPFFGLCLYIWLDYVGPDLLFAGPLTDVLRLSLLTGIATILGTLCYQKKLRLGNSWALKFFILFGIWVTITSVFSEFPDTAWVKWERFIKNFIMVILGVWLVDSRERLLILIGTVFTATALHATRGAIVTVTTGGGGYAVVGTSGTYLAERNYIALAFVFAVWIGIFLCIFINKHRGRDMIFWVGVIATVCCAISAIGTQSRGALVATAASIAIMSLFSKRKIRIGLITVTVIGIVLLTAPESWLERMGSIDEYKTDSSSMSRLDTWKFAWNYALEHPWLGGGFTIFRKNLSELAATGVFDAHSFYFEVLAEHGFVGLALIILFLISLLGGLIALVIKNRREEQSEFSQLPIYVLAGSVALFVGGGFGILSTFLMTYIPLVITASYQKIKQNSPAHEVGI